MNNLKYALAAGLGLVVVLTGIRLWSLNADAQTESATASTSAQAQGRASSANAGNRGSGGGGSGRGGGRPPALVVTTPVSTALVNDRLKAVGNGTARASVSIVPLSGGILSQVMVQPGQRVDANSVLARFDDEEQLIAKERAALAVVEATSDVERLENLYRSRTTTEVELNRAKTVLSDSRFELRDATLTFDRRTIRAPIAGVVGFVSVDEGNYVSAQTEIMTVDDRSKIIVEFWVPERFANEVSVDQSIKAVALANPGVQYTGTIIGVGSRVETDSRTLPVKASIDNTGDTLRPGMSFELNLDFDGETFPAVSPLAIQWDSKGAYVWNVVDSKVQRMAVTIIQRNPESVLVNAELSDGDAVVVEGVLSLRNGANVRVQGAPAGPAKQDKAGQGNQSNPGRQGKPTNDNPAAVTKAKPAEPATSAKPDSTS